MADGFHIPEAMQTQRLLLRPLTTDDAEAVLSYGSDPLVTRYLTWPTHQTIDDSLDFVRRVVAGYQTGPVHTWAIQHTTDGRMIGTFGIDHIDHANLWCSIGYVLARGYWGQGLMTESLRKVIDSAFRFSPLNRVEAYCLPANVGSSRVMVKSGMTFEGLRREAHHFKGRFHDASGYAILRREWNAAIGRR